MKKIYKSVLFTIIAAAGFTACSDYEAPDITTESVISITGYETSFPASASTGSITFEAKGPVTVTTNNQWITASVDGNRIDIAVDQNNAFSGRSGSITVKCGNATDNISIIQSGIIFKYDDVSTIDIDSDAWSQTYKADATLPVSVTSDSEWLKASLTDGILTIAADRNTKLQARTGIVTISVGNLTNDITVNQGPLIFPLVKVTEISQNDDAKTYTYDFPSDIPVQFNTESSWIHATFANETVTITVDENNSGHMRSGSLSYSLEGADGSLTISQYDFDKDIAGEYQWIFTDPSDGKNYYFPATMKRDGSNYTLDFTVGAYKLSAPLKWNDATKTLNLAGGAYLGKWSSYFAYMCYTFYDPEEDAIFYTWDTKPSMNASFTYFESQGMGITAAAFVDAKTFDYALIAMQIRAFKAQPASSASSAGYIKKMEEPILMRTQTLPEEGGNTEETTAATPLKKTAAAKIASAKPALGTILNSDTMLAR